ncbi:MAG: zinc ribbon domain-containing protein [Elainellaceae cyanobacterium]
MLDWYMLTLNYSYRIYPSLEQEARMIAWLEACRGLCFKRGVYYGKVDPNGTSQECPDCGARVPKSLSDRVHRCHECGST